jgi:hypothetical protein
MVQVLDGVFAIDDGHHHMAMAWLDRPVDHQHVTVTNASVLHRRA